MANVDIGQVIFYFNKKGREWVSQATTVEDYIRNAGVKGLSQEFRNDPPFVCVCNFISYAGTIQLRSSIAKGLEEYAGLLFGVPLLGTMDIIIGAIEEACGKRVAGELMAKGLMGVLLGAVIIGVLGAITK
jgi:hypothetical protein